MVTLNQVTNGLQKYIEAEILPMVSDWRKWVLGAGASVALSKSAEIFAKLKANPMIAALGVIDNDDRIDIERLHREFAKQAQKGAITLDVPLLGPVTLNAQDVDRLYHDIVGGNE
jgi:hypothetical protein